MKEYYHLPSAMGRDYQEELRLKKMPKKKKRKQCTCATHGSCAACNR